MLGELLQAIKLRCAAKSLGSTFPGGIQVDSPIPGTTWPLVVVSIVGSSNTARASSVTANRFNQTEVATLDFHVHSKSGLSAASTLVETVKAAFDNAVLMIGSDVTLLKLWYVGESVADDPDHPNIKDWTITYQAMMEQAKVLVNT